jgi:hypothetical protein
MVPVAPSTKTRRDCGERVVEGGVDLMMECEHSDASSPASGIQPWQRVDRTGVAPQPEATAVLASEMSNPTQ